MISSRRFSILLHLDRILNDRKWRQARKKEIFIAKVTQFIAHTIFLVTAIFFITSSAASKNADKHLVGCWVWNIVDLATLSDCNTFLLYQGDIRIVDGGAAFIKRGFNPFKIDDHKEIAIVIRLDVLVDPEYVKHQFAYLATQWFYRGIEVRELQIDFDSASNQLDQYAKFIEQLKLELPDVSVSVTGLSSWVYDNPKGLTRLNQFADYVAVQLYKSYEPHSKHAQIARDISKMELSYKLGITRSPNFDISTLAKGKEYRGHIIFINK